MNKRKKIRGQQRFAARPKLSQLFTARSRANRARGNDAIRRAHLEHGYSLSEIGRAVKLHYWTISRIVNPQEGDGAQNEVGPHILADTIRDIGRLLLEMPRRVTMGVPYMYQVQDAREATLSAVLTQHPEVARAVANAPMQRR